MIAFAPNKVIAEKPKEIEPEEVDRLQREEAIKRLGFKEVRESIQILASRDSSFKGL